MAVWPSTATAAPTSADSVTGLFSLGKVRGRCHTMLGMKSTMVWIAVAEMQS